MMLFNMKASMLKKNSVTSRRIHSCFCLMNKFDVAKASKRLKIDNGRYYDMQGKNFPSVTSILGIIDKPALKQWSVKMALNSIIDQLFQVKTNPLTGDVMFNAEQDKQIIDQIKDNAKKAPDNAAQAAAQLGTDAHNAIDALVQGKPIPDNLIHSNVVQNVVAAFRQWQTDTSITIDRRGDTRVFSEIYGFAGAMDAFGWDKNGSLVVIDFKTSNHIFPPLKLQVVAYAKAFEEMQGGKVPVKRCVVVRFDKFKPEYEMMIVEEEEMESCYNAFKAALYLWNWVENAKK
jgi:hypothetical protein